MDAFAFIESLPSADELVDIREENSSLDDEKAEQARIEDKRKALLFIECYRRVLMGVIQAAVRELGNSSNKFCTQLELDARKHLFVDNGLSSIPFHIVHYGGNLVPTSSGQYNWKKRESNPMFAGLFKELQTALLARGYYLLDISDPSKSFNFVIKLYLGKPTWYDEAPTLWHGLNKI